MGTTLIFVGLVVCDGSRVLSRSYWIEAGFEVVPGNSPTV